MDQDTFNKLMMDADLDQENLNQINNNANTQNNLNTDQSLLSNFSKNVGNRILEGLYLKQKPSDRAAILSGDLLQLQIQEAEKEAMARQDVFNRDNLLKQQITQHPYLNDLQKEYLLGPLSPENRLEEYSKMSVPLTDEQKQITGFDPNASVYTDIYGVPTSISKKRLLTSEEKKNIPIFDDKDVVQVDLSDGSYSVVQDNVSYNIQTGAEVSDRFHPDTVLKVNSETGEAEIVKDVNAPVDMIWSPDDGKFITIPGSKKDMDENKTEEKREKSENSWVSQMASLNTEIDRAMEVLNDDDSLWNSLMKGELPASGWGAMFQEVPGTDALSLRSRLDQMKSFVARDALRKMRESSPTGGALGNVSNFEVEMLMAAYGSLSQDQSVEDLKFNLDRLRFIVRTIIDPSKSDAQSLDKVMVGGEVISYLPLNAQDSADYVELIKSFSAGDQSWNIKNNSYDPDVVDKRSHNEVKFDLNKMKITPNNSTQIGGTNLQQMTDEQLQEELARLEGQL